MLRQNSRTLYLGIQIMLRDAAVLVGFVVVLAGLPGGPRPRAATQPTAAANTVIADLMARDLVGSPGREVRMLTVEYLAGGASLPHRHNAQVFVYVLEGSVRMQVAGWPEVTLGPGGCFYEGPDDVHSVAANASAVEPAKILVFMVRDKNAPVSIPMPAGAAP